MGRNSTIGLALGGGSARGLAHILMLEAFDELDLKPSVIAGTSIGAIMGALYASGHSAGEIRAYFEELLARRSGVIRRLTTSLDALSSLWSVRAPSVVDGVTLFEMLMPPTLRTSFEALRIPFIAVACDFHAMKQVNISHGPLIPAIAASAALPSILRPVKHEGRVLIDGGFANPTPFDVVAPHASFTVAVDVTGRTKAARDGEMPTPFEAWVGATQIMFHTIVDHRMAVCPPDLMVRPNVGGFSTLDFLRFREIFAAAQPAKDELKRGLEQLVERGQSKQAQ